MAAAAVFVWAVAEAVFWPIIPDFLLVLLVAGNRRRFYIPLIASIAGSALGGTAIVLFAYWRPDQALDFLHGLPLLSDDQIQDASDRLSDHGVIAFVFQPWSGIPFKAWGVAAGVQNLEPWLVIPTFIVARAARMAIVAILVRMVVGTFVAFFRDFSILFFVLYLVLFFYGWWQTQVAA